MRGAGEPHRRSSIYYRFTPLRLAFSYGSALVSFVAVYLGFRTGLLVAAGASMVACAVLAYYVHRRIHPSAYEAPAMQEFYASKIPADFWIGVVLILLTIVRPDVPAGEVEESLLYAFVGWFVAALNAANLGLFILYVRGALDLYVARTPYWTRRWRKLIPGSDGEGFFTGDPGDRRK